MRSCGSRVAGHHVCVVSLRHVYAVRQGSAAVPGPPAQPDDGTWRAPWAVAGTVVAAVAAVVGGRGAGPVGRGGRASGAPVRRHRSYADPHDMARPSVSTVHRPCMRKCRGRRRVPSTHGKRPRRGAGSTWSSLCPRAAVATCSAAQAEGSHGPCAVRARERGDGVRKGSSVKSRMVFSQPAPQHRKCRSAVTRRGGRLRRAARVVHRTAGTMTLEEEPDTPECAGPARNGPARSGVEPPVQPDRADSRSRVSTAARPPSVGAARSPLSNVGRGRTETPTRQAPCADAEVSTAPHRVTDWFRSSR
ncbi:hypothetical protein SHL15_9077 [Streptomyces hygroscopicus subsp. limoneus]|nr:hypothetical protein SHL15_9077 [Streptomyces hygroscopicus subsp. limoneus]